MQPQDTTHRTAGAVKHPDAAEWMAFLYEEVGPQRKRELETHLAECATCTEQLSTWRSGMTALNEWKVPAVRKPVRVRVKTARSVCLRMPRRSSSSLRARRLTAATA